MSHFRSPSSSCDSGDSDDSRDSRNPRASGEYEGMAGNDHASPGRAYAQRAWDEDALTFVDMRTPGRSSSHQTSPAGEGVSPGRPPSQQDEYSSNESGEDDYGEDESGEDDYGGDEDEGDDDEPLHSQQVEGMPEHTLPSNPQYAPQSVPSAPPIYVSSHDVPSTRPSESGHSAQALAPGMSQGEGHAELEFHHMMDEYEPHHDYADFDEQYAGIYFGDTPFQHPSQDPSPSGGTPLPLRPAGESSSERSAQRISPRSRPNVSPHHLPSAQGSVVAQGSPSPPDRESHDGSASSGGSVAARASPSVQEPATAPGQYQRGGLSGARYVGQHLDPHQRDTGHQKRARESSSSSSASHTHPPRKQHGYQGPRVPQRVSQDQNIDATLRGISGLEARGQAQPPSASRPYGGPDPYKRPRAPEAEAEAEEIRRAYANQVVPAPRLPNPFAGMPQGASSAYAGGAGRGYDRPTQGESSAQGAGRSQPYPAPPGGPSAPEYQPMQGAGPGAASSWTGGTWRGNPPQAQSQGESSGQGAGQFPQEQRREPGDPFITTFGPSVGVPQPQSQPQPQQVSGFRPEWGPMQGMAASDIWRYISGQEDNEDVNWDERLYLAVDPTKQGHLWPSHHVAQLRVILASYLSWEEVVDQGQPLPGQRNYEACAAKARSTSWSFAWTREHDVEVSRLSSPSLEDRRAALNRLQGEFDRSKDEIVGRCMLFARTSLRLNLGNKPTTGLARLKKRG